MQILEQFTNHITRRTAGGRPSPHTLRSYTAQAKMFLTWCEGRGLDPVQVTNEQVIDYRQSLSQYAPATVALKLQVVKTLFDALDVEPNPAQGVGGPPDRTADGERITYLTVEQVQRVRTLLEGRVGVAAIRDRAMLALLVTFGLRASELRQLRLCDVVLMERQPGRLLVLGKGRKKRTLHLTPTTAETLRSWLAVRPGLHTPSGPLFLGVTGRGGLSDSGLRKVVKGWLKDADLGGDGMACHVFRHTALTLAVMGGAVREHVQRMAGHADARTTDLYVHLVESERDNPALAVESVLC